MNKIFIYLFGIIHLSLSDVCSDGQCKCSNDRTIVQCDSKFWTSLENISFPLTVTKLTLNNNKLTFNRVDDRLKIENLSNLLDLSLNENPLAVIPPFRQTKIRFLSLQDTSITSAEFPSSYNESVLQTISLNQNKIRSINENDFLFLSRSNLRKLHLDNIQLTSIDRNSFLPLKQLQSLSLKQNRLKSLEFVSTISFLSSINLDENQFSSLPDQLISPENIKTYSFRRNFISIIDESSPLNQWQKKNFTEMKIYLENNSFDCCSSMWFIRFIQTSKFVADSELLHCASPSEFLGEKLIHLDPDRMNCPGTSGGQNWWTTGRIVVFSVLLFLVVTVSSIVTISFIRKRRFRSGYSPIGDSVEPSAILNEDRPFPVSDNEEEEEEEEEEGGGDRFSSISDFRQTGSIRESIAPTINTNQGIDATDLSQTGDSQITDRAILPPRV